LYEPREG